MTAKTIESINFLRTRKMFLCSVFPVKAKTIPTVEQALFLNLYYLSNELSERHLSRHLHIIEELNYFIRFHVHITIVLEMVWLNTC